MKSSLKYLWIAIFFATAPMAHAASAAHGMKHLYLSYCVLCHGEDGKSGGALSEKMKLKVSDLNDPKVQALNVDSVAKLIGGSGGAKRVESKMPNWEKELPPHILKGIATYVKNISSAEAESAPDCSKKSPAKEVYDNACLACHGRYGNGKGLLAVLIGLHDSKGKPMIDWTKKDYTKSPAEIKKAILMGQGEMMPGWKPSLCENEVDDVVNYILDFKNAKK